MPKINLPFEISADEVADGAAKVQMTIAEREKLGTLRPMDIRKQASPPCTQ